MNRPLSRRRFLGGAGALLALPFLESLVPRALAADPPRRTLFYYVPNGMHMPAWTPKGAGAAFELSPILAPLQPHKADLLVLSGLSNRPGKPEGPGDHAGGTGAFLTCKRVKKSDTDVENAVSVDQIIAARAGKQTRFASLQLGLEGGTSAGGCDSGFSCAYTRNISWAGPKTPLQKSVSPQVVFDLLFKGTNDAATQAERERRARDRRSVLDYALADAGRLRGRLGAADRQKLDEYMSGVREVEARLDGVAASCQAGAGPPGDGAFPDQVRLMSDLMVLALQCDLTRVVSFMLGNAASGRSYAFLGVSGAHHEISHHQNNPDNFTKLQTIDTWEVSQLAYLVGRLKQVKEGGGTLLDSTLVFFSSEIADGNSHSHVDLPVVLAGRYGGALRPGRHIVYQDRPLSNLFLSLLAANGIQQDRFGDDSTGPLPDLA